MDISKIFKSAYRGWKMADLGWRKVAFDCQVDPDKFLELPGSSDMVACVQKLPLQVQVQFFNQICRRYPFLRL
ncbi:MAG: hypothetical protein RID09_20370 [Coleofasciculus sp. G1-WW12-02]|uniref:hypothetical protein n=1 Tax=Coleofasciculus sp. G1-WW12-02 TaxID=3068483 RepID=UPI0032F3FFF4